MPAAPPTAPPAEPSMTTAASTPPSCGLRAAQEFSGSGLGGASTHTCSVTVPGAGRAPLLDDDDVDEAEVDGLLDWTTGLQGFPSHF